MTESKQHIEEYIRLLYIPKLPLTELFCLTLDLERMGF